ncbi:hypothetical protein GW17_00037196 [Ensete ventricosum]|nr:hypothetical protein GW17_00037196 [Ensete ventricosum]
MLSNSQHREGSHDTTASGRVQQSSAPTSAPSLVRSHLTSLNSRRRRRPTASVKPPAVSPISKQPFPSPITEAPTDLAGPTRYLHALSSSYCCCLLPLESIANAPSLLLRAQQSFSSSTAINSASSYYRLISPCRTSRSFPALLPACNSAIKTDAAKHLLQFLCPL